MASFRELSEDIQERINEILMDSKLSVIVEGDNDILAYEEIFNEDECHFEQFGGKDKALSVITKVNEINSQKAIAILDNDLDKLLGKEYPTNVFFTDAHDIDAQMFFSNSFFRVAKEYFAKSNTSSKQKMLDIKRQIEDYSHPLAIMRMVSNELELYFAFKPSKDHPKAFPYGKLLKVNSRECEYLGDENLVKVTCQYRNQGIKLDQKELVKKMIEIKSRNYEYSMILHGHDLMNIMGLLVLRYGKTKSSAISSDDLERSFRLAYATELSNSELFKRLKNYFQNQNLNCLNNN